MRHVAHTRLWHQVRHMALTSSLWGHAPVMDGRPAEEDQSCVSGIL